MRLVASGLAAPAAVKRAALAAFGVAALAGLALAVAVGWELLVVGAAAIAAGWFYTGGPHPYGYYGFGELFVFVFFGLVATAGTTYVLIERLTALSLVAGAAVGALACALLVVNNLRDIPTDRAAGKRTLAGPHRRSPDPRALHGARHDGVRRGAGLCRAVALAGGVDRGCRTPRLRSGREGACRCRGP